MSPPEPRKNTFFQKTSKPVVEPISKIFIIASLILGINRLPLLGTTNITFIVIMLTYTTFLNVFLFYLTIRHNYLSDKWTYLNTIDCFQYLISTILGFVLHKRLVNFYLNMNTFDQEFGMRMTKIAIKESVYSFLQLIITLLQTVALYSYIFDNEFDLDFTDLLNVTPIKLLNCFELHYYGHLISLMIPRLKAISDAIEFSFPNKKQKDMLKILPADELRIQENKPRVNMNKLMDFYNNIVVTYDYLNDAVKWQILTLLISTFSITLFSLYRVVKAIIWGDENARILLPTCISLTILHLFPLLVPCVFADRIQKEVRLMKDNLACKLYENTLDKPSRSAARTLLALIETRNLSFSLFHMFDIDIELPFKYMALLLTYLIILLQFDKVISPNKPSKP